MNEVWLLMETIHHPYSVSTLTDHVPATVRFGCGQPES